MEWSLSRWSWSMSPPQEKRERCYQIQTIRYKKIILNYTGPSSCNAQHDLSFATSFSVAVLFLMVNASIAMN